MPKGTKQINCTVQRTIWPLQAKGSPRPFPLDSVFLPLFFYIILAPSQNLFCSPTELCNQLPFTKEILLSTKCLFFLILPIDKLTFLVEEKTVSKQPQPSIDLVTVKVIQVFHNIIPPTIFMRKITIAEWIWTRSITNKKKSCLEWKQCNQSYISSFALFCILITTRNPCNSISASGRLATQQYSSKCQPVLW